MASASLWMRPSTTSTCRGAACTEIPSHTFAPVINVAAIVVTSLISEAVAQNPRSTGARLRHPHQTGRYAGAERIQVDLWSMGQAGLLDQRQTRTPRLGHVGVLKTPVGPLVSDRTEHNFHGNHARPADASIVV